LALFRYHRFHTPKVFIPTFMVNPIPWRVRRELPSTPESGHHPNSLTGPNVPTLRRSNPSGRPGWALR
jgi:hypothetical protein